jgi:predicted RecB family nuclease
MKRPAPPSPQLPLFGEQALPRLSKSRYAAGVQCHKLLWWKAHEPGAVELQPDKVLQDRFDQGAQVGALARERFPGGVLIDLPHNAVAERLEQTRAALDAGFPFIFEASFVADDTFVAIDVLERLDRGFRLVEVKSASSQKEEHVPDAAVQAHVARRNSVDVRAVEIMHLNKAHRFPDQGDLFARTDVTHAVEQMLPDLPAELSAQLDALRGPLPDVPIGLHCFEPRQCPFFARCWPQTPDHIMKLYLVGPKRACDYILTGVHTIDQIPPKQKLSDPAKRQIRAMNENRLIVEPRLKAALEPFTGRLGFLDFETISRAVPVWPGMAPWEQAAAQFSYHEAQGDGTYRHVGYLAEGPQDARPPLARAMLAATAGAERIVMYTPFERTRIRSLQLAVPELAADLKALEDKLIDLHPVIRDHVYHPDFQGSFSLKYVLHPLVPELTYNDLVIVDGLVASVEIARLLFVAQRIPPDERDRVRQDLLDYCERDTWAMVKLLERLRELAGA